MNQVITQEQAKQITHGRPPLTVVPYEEACRQLALCQTIDECQYWDNASDALAAWAKIFHDDEATRKARAVKLRAFRTMGILSARLRPNGMYKKREDAKSGQAKARVRLLPGSKSLLIEKGLTRSAAGYARALGEMPEEKFERIVNVPRPPLPSTALANERSGMWSDISQRSGFRPLIYYSKTCSAIEFSNMVPPERTQGVRAGIIALIEWLDEVERRLPGSAAP